MLSRLARPLCGCGPLVIGFLLGLAALSRAGLPVPELGETPTNAPLPGIAVPPALRSPSATNLPATGLVAEAVTLRRFVQPLPCAEDRLLLVDGKELAGQLVAWEQSRILWKPAGQSATATQALGQVLAVRLAAPPDKPLPAKGRWIVQLIDGSLVLGSSIKLGPQELELTGGASGLVRLPRTGVHRLQQALPDQATHPFQWPRQWRQVAALGPASVMEDLNLADQVSLELVLPPSQPRRLVLHLYTADPGQDPGYTINFHDREVRVHTVAGVPAKLQQIRLPADRANQLGIPVELRVSRTAGVVEVYAHGQLLGKQSLPPLADGASRQLVIRTQDLKQVLPPWLLITPLAPGLESPAPTADQDLLGFANGETVLGRLESAEQGGDLVCTSARGRLVVPIDRLRLTKLSTAGRAASDARADDLLVELRDGTQLVGRLDKLTETELVLDGLVLGALRVPRQAVALVYKLGSPPVTRAGR